VDFSIVGKLSQTVLIEGWESYTELRDVIETEQDSVEVIS
jgi:hypothetical protein